MDVVAMKCFADNVPDYVEDRRLASALTRLGVEFRLHTDPESWGDFTEVDAVLCERRDRTEVAGWAMEDKPPTKLINAWCAGVIPIVSPEPAYVQLIEDDLDAVSATGLESVVDAVAHLREDPEVTTRRFSRVRARGAEFSTERVLDEWEELLWGTPIESRRSEAARALVRFAGERLTAHAARGLKRARWGTKRVLKGATGRIRRGSPRA